MKLAGNQLVVAGMAALVAIGLFLAFAPNEEKRVRKTFDRVAALLGKEANEPMITSAAKAKALGELVTAAFRFKAPEIGINQSFDSASISECAAMMRAHEQHITVTFSELTVEFPADKANTAEVLGNVQVDSEHHLGFKDKNTRSFEATLKKDAETKAWRFAATTVSP